MSLEEPVEMNSIMGETTKQTIDMKTVSDTGESQYSAMLESEEPNIVFGNIDERIMLDSWFHKANGEHWTTNTNWTKHSILGERHGITMNAIGHVTGLNLLNNNLNGVIPDDIDTLSSLNTLILSYNQLCSSIPHRIGNLQFLEVFHANNCNIEGKLPDSIGKLSHLTELQLCHNQLSELPSTLGSLTNLKELKLSRNKIIGKMPSILSLKHLEVLNLDHNNIQGSIPSIVHIVNLKEINLSNNNFSGPLPEDWCSLKLLKRVNLSCNRLSGSIHLSFFQLPSILELDLSNNKFFGTLPDLASVLSCPLQSLDVSQNNLSGNLPILKPLVNLTSLNLFENSLTSNSLEECLKGLKAIKMLNFSNNKFKCPLPVSFLHHTKNLVSFQIHKNLISGMIPNFIDQLTLLEEFNISNNAITSSIPSSIGKLTNLRVLNVANNRMSGAIPEDIFRMPSLQSFDISGNNYPVTYLRPYLEGIQFSAFEKTVLSRELTCKGFEKNSLNSLTNLSRKLISCTFKDHSKPVAEISTESEKNIVISRRSSDDLKVFLMLLLNHEELIAQPIYGRQRSSTNIEWNTNPSQIIKLIKEPFYELFSSLIQSESRNLFGPFLLLKMYNILQFTKENFPSTDIEVSQYENGISDALGAIMSLSSVDDKKIFYRLLIPGMNLTSPIGYSDLLLEESLIGFSVEKNLKPIFSSPNVESLLREIFDTSSRLRPQPQDKLLRRIKNQDDEYKSPAQRYAALYYQAFQNSRYCPLIMYYTRCLSSTITLYLTSTVLKITGTQKSQVGIIHPETTIEERILSIITIGICLYELGQFSDANFSIQVYASTMWNKMDLAICLTLGFWLFGTFFIVNSNRAALQLSLALSAIPQSISLLQYLCLNRPLGQLVIMIFAMLRTILHFAVVFVFCILGFGIYFNGLYGDQEDYTTAYKTALKLFQSTLGGYDFDSFGSGYYAVVASVVLVFYLIFTTFLLINLLIAKMSNAQSEVNSKAQQEWAFFQASLLTEYAIEELGNPLCMLPSPFNLLTALVYYIGIFYLSQLNWLRVKLTRSDSVVVPGITQYDSQSIVVDSPSRTVSVVSTIANILMRLTFFVPIVVSSAFHMHLNSKIDVELIGFHYKSPDNLFKPSKSKKQSLSLQPTYKCCVYLGFTDNVGVFHGWKSERDITTSPIDFSKSDHLHHDIVHQISSHSLTNSKTGYILNKDIHLMSEELMSIMDSSDNIRKLFLNEYWWRKYLKPLVCAGLSLYEYVYCFWGDSIVYIDSSDNSDYSHLPASLGNLIEQNNGDVNVETDEFNINAQIYSEEDTIDLLRLLNQRSETVDRIETVKLYVKKLHSDVDDLRAKLGEVDQRIDSQGKSQLDSITELIDRNVDELRYLIHK